jgi:transcriptional regulator with XRE-family HTH domain
VSVAISLNLSASRISAYENGENIPCNILRNFADFYGVSIDYILYFSDSKNCGLSSALRVSEQKLLDFYRNLSPDGKAVVDGMVKGYTPSK